jgi:hypothetical protein
MSTALLWRVAALAGFALVAGCATPGGAPDPYPFSEGWRKAEVVQVLAGTDVPDPGFWECLRGATPQAIQSGEYVILSYRAFNRQRKRLVALPKTMSLQPRQQVWLDVDACEGAVALRAP